MKTYATPKNTLKIPTPDELDKYVIETHLEVSTQIKKAGEEIIDVKVAETLAVESDRVMELWQHFLEQKNGSPTEYNVLNRPIIWDKFSGKLFLTLTSEMQLAVLNKVKNELIEFLTSKTGLSNIDIEIEIDNTDQEQTKTLYTNKDKYEYLAKSTPALVEFVKRLGLELD